MPCMARGIVRFSLDNDAAASGQNTTAARKLLESEGFVKIGTSSYESKDMPMNDVLGAIAKLCAQLHRLPHGVTVDHLWVYLDEPED